MENKDKISALEYLKQVSPTEGGLRAALYEEGLLPAVNSVMEKYAEFYAAEKLKEKDWEIESLRRECLDVHRDWKVIDDELRNVKSKADKLVEALIEISEVSASRPRGSDTAEAYGECLDIAKEALSTYHSENNK